MIPMWFAFALHVLGIAVGAMCHALATRNRRAPKAETVPFIVGGKEATRLRVVTTTIRDE